MQETKSIGEILSKEIEEYDLRIANIMIENRGLWWKLVEEIREQLLWEEIIKSLWVYGSFETELDLPWSDIDIVVDGKLGQGYLDYTLR